MKIQQKKPDLKYETPLWEKGITRLAGLDEAGRGAWAGPVAAGAVILPDTPAIACQLEDVRDSKLMTPRQRACWAAKIKACAVAWGVGFASSQEIDELGIVPATRLAMMRSLEHLRPGPTYLLIDALHLKESRLPQASLVRGDQCSLSIAAASVLAKTSRDELMVSLDEAYPGYRFGKHKGYGTAAHLEALRALSICPQHRQSFKPVKRLLEVAYDDGG